MMSTRALAVFIVCLAASTAFVSAIGFSDVIGETEVGVEERVGETEEELRDVAPEDEDRSNDGLLSLTYGAVSILRDVAGMVFFLPQVLHNLGLPMAAATFISAPVYVVVGLSLVEFARGDRLR
ncbi:hypothetical protein [Natrarchaeobius chitinivorans]|uniref:Uncharacterized protein n=1 Tax=Natrarchaeobius chitinivorans TaxID=1679083 RepID=A0A3N6M7H8_NATCH|nr:hypothetical protein [Natrarchaeobius chitinivorans]RQG89326.1 hypothetical protein EA473_22215 [Natrarchaeobius chitinivorans]